MEEWFSRIGGRIKEVHLHDNRGRYDAHMPMGEGEIDFSRFFSLLASHPGEPLYTIEPHGEDALWRGLEAAARYLPAGG